MRTANFRGIVSAAAFGAVAVSMAGVTNKAEASGFGLREGSADWMANAFAGDTAKAYDASTIWSNPAGMVRLNQSEIDGSINGIFPSINFSGANFVGPTSTTPGTTGGNLIQSAATGGVYALWSITPDFKLGFGADAPFGQRVANPGDFVGRYQSLVSSITDEQFTISAAYKINEQWSIGGGPVIDFFSARLTQAINIGPVSAITGDPNADLHGDDTSAGFNLGVLYQITPDMRVGLDYRSRIQHDISGTQSIYVPPLLGLLSPPTAALLAAQYSNAGTKITLPDSVTLGFYWQATPQLAILSDISWTDWSLLKNINIVPTNPSAAPTTIVENWRNTVAVSVGANYQLSKELMLQGGFGFDESPVTDSNRTSRIPDSNRYLIGIGAQYDILPNLTLQVAYAHVFFEEAPVTTQASATSGILSGKYSSAANTASLGVKYRF
ncbi:MAG: outer membrane protein transport protein [Rhodopila sp.]|nr:outer membrane protein transport protein [Rhodopila sp.]